MMIDVIQKNIEKKLREIDEVVVILEEYEMNDFDLGCIAERLETEVNRLKWLNERMGYEIEVLKSRLGRRK